ncbi:MAG: hypothetical protein JSR28_19105, partial [Proteobacteria bacterium]|nr:hypothetical protein [Pseudomonadota bacterium]
DRIYFRLANRTDAIEQPSGATKVAEAATKPKPAAKASDGKGEQN